MGDHSYTVDPRDVCPDTCTDAQRQRIIGGEACQWGEGVDATNLFSSVWPDLTMVGERLWFDGDAAQLDLLDGIRVRLRRQRCRLVSRGVPVPTQAAVYVPDASHASFALWRELQWCEGDAGDTGPPEPSAAIREEAARMAQVHRLQMSQRPRRF